MKKPLLLIASLTLAASASYGQVIFDDTTDFSNWYKAGTGGTLNKAGSSLVWQPGTANNADELIGRSFASNSLAIGESIEATFTMIANTPGIFRIGLGDSTVAFTADNWLSTTGDYEGYYTFARTNGADGDARSETGSFPSEPTGGLTQSTITTAGQTSESFGGTTSYDVTFSITYTGATQMDTLLTIVDPTGPSTRVSIAGSTSTIYDTFDTLLLRGDTGTMTFDNISVTSTAIPEPSSFALMAGALGGIALLRRKRR